MVLRLSGFWAADLVRALLPSRSDDRPLPLRSHVLAIGIELVELAMLLVSWPSVVSVKLHPGDKKTKRKTKCNKIYLFVYLSLSLRWSLTLRGDRIRAVSYCLGLFFHSLLFVFSVLTAFVFCQLYYLLSFFSTSSNHAFLSITLIINF